MADTRPYEEMYNLNKDPYEVNNLADDAAYQEKKEDMSNILDTWIKATGDQGAEPGKNEVVIKWYKHAREQGKNFAQENGFDPDISDEAYIEEYWKEEMGLK